MVKAAALVIGEQTAVGGDVLCRGGEFSGRQITDDLSGHISTQLVDEMLVHAVSVDDSSVYLGGGNVGKA